MSFRKIEALPADATLRPPASFGPLPELRWLPVDLLRIDDSYQRPISRNGERNVKKIVEEFSWTKFAPVVVCPVAGGFYVIVDGQHRTTAAHMCGVREVPCLVIQADGPAQAKAFHAINGNVTGMTRPALYKAMLASGDPHAVRINHVAERAGVKVLTYTPSWSNLRPRETMCHAFLFNLVKKYQDDHLLVRGLRMAADCAGTNKGLLSPMVISTFVDLASRWNHASCFDGVGLATLHGQAVREGTNMAAKIKLLTHWLDLRARANQNAGRAGRCDQPVGDTAPPVPEPPAKAPVTAKREQVAAPTPVTKPDPPTPVSKPAPPAPTPSRTPPVPTPVTLPRLSVRTTYHDMPVVDDEYIAKMVRLSKDDPLRKAYVVRSVDGGFGAFEKDNPQGTQYPFYAVALSDLEDVLRARGLEKKADGVWYPRRK